MDINDFYYKEGEQPLDRLVTDGGFCGIFRTIGIIGDSLSSGEFESFHEGIRGWHDFYDYSWGQYIAREAGCKVYNFTRGGMTAEEFIKSFSAHCKAFDYDNLCQAYIIALGVNDINGKLEVGEAKSAFENAVIPEAPAIMDYYGAIIKNIKRKQPDAKIFLVTLPNDTTWTDEKKVEKRSYLNAQIGELAELYENTYIIDLEKYAPEYDEKFKKTFFLGHMTATGYMLTAKMVMSYIDYIIRKYPKDFSQVGFIGTPYKYELE
ncbi:MAG: SGNH/GDSL hydrolase family protein [Clostridia bacterium]|nr:SGNH/GDSL hydrolase family protein [Clostridia bacterium]